MGILVVVGSSPISHPKYCKALPLSEGLFTLQHHFVCQGELSKVDHWIPHAYPQVCPMTQGSSGVNMAF